MMGMMVKRPGILALLQDAGRRGVMHFGLANGGVMDRHAWAWANHLLGNAWGAPAIEVTLGGMVLEVQSCTAIAVCGADLSLQLNGQPLPLWRVHRVEAGDQLSFGHPRQGMRAYLAVSGGFQVSQSLGHSCATVMREGTGGLKGDGQRLQAGDILPFAAQQPSDMLLARRVPDRWIPDYQADLALDVVLGAQADSFPAEALTQFFDQSWTVSTSSDRMGARLEGGAIQGLCERMISEGIGLGAIQVPADGQPIILLNDRQTVGGYPKLGAVTPRALDLLAQRQFGSPITFRSVPLHEAQCQERQFLNFFASTV